MNVCIARLISSEIWTCQPIINNIMGPERLTLFMYFSLPAPQTILHIIEDIDLLGRQPSDHEDDAEEVEVQSSAVESTSEWRKPQILPLFSSGKSTENNLDNVSLSMKSERCRYKFWWLKIAKLSFLTCTCINYWYTSTGQLHTHTHTRARTVLMLLAQL